MEESSSQLSFFVGINSCQQRDSIVPPKINTPTPHRCHNPILPLVHRFPLSSPLLFYSNRNPA